MYNNIFRSHKAALEEAKKKMDPVNKKELEGDHDEREDQDIDNDGDVDAADEYLHNRRKAVSKAIEDEKEGKKQIDDEVLYTKKGEKIAGKEDEEDEDSEEASEANGNMSDKKRAANPLSRGPRGDEIKSDKAGETSPEVKSDTMKRSKLSSVREHRMHDHGEGIIGVPRPAPIPKRRPITPEERNQNRLYRDAAMAQQNFQDAADQGASAPAAQPEPEKQKRGPLEMVGRIFGAIRDLMKKEDFDASEVEALAEQLGLNESVELEEGIVDTIVNAYETLSGKAKVAADKILAALGHRGDPYRSAAQRQLDRLIQSKDRNVRPEGKPAPPVGGGIRYGNPALNRYITGMQEMQREEVNMGIREKLVAFLENREMHTKGATEPEGMDEKEANNKGAREMKQAAKDAIANPDDTEEKGHQDASDAGRVTNPAGNRGDEDVRSGDQVVHGSDETMNQIMAVMQKMNGAR